MTGAQVQNELLLEPTHRQLELIESAQQWREYAKSASPEGLARACIASAVSLEKEAEDGIARCVCCMKPL
jgi:hypothetical protein